MVQISRMPLRQGPFMGDFWSDMFSTLVQTVPVGLQAYQAKREADRARQARERAEAVEDAAVAAAAAEKARADAAAKAEALAQQGLSPTGAPLPETTILGMKPVYVIGGVAALGLLGIAAAVFLKK